MLGLIVRLGLLLAIVFGVAYGITRALRQNAHSKAAKRIQGDVRALKQGLEAGLYTVQEYRDFSDRIRVACKKEGIEVPDLPQYEEPSSRRES